MCDYGQLSPPPGYFEHRIKLWDKLKAKQDEELKNKPREPIVIKLPNGSTKEGTSWETSPLDIAKGLSKSLSERIIIAQVCYSRSVRRSAC